MNVDGDIVDDGLTQSACQNQKVYTHGEMVHIAIC